MSASRVFNINFMGDTMLGRLIDQLLPTHVHEPKEAQIVKSFLSSRSHLHSYGPESPWGTTISLLHQADLNVLNLETSATTSTAKWPDKVFNYRMHPENIRVLSFAQIDYAGLANNHTLDFSEEGLFDTVRTVRDAGIAFAGAGTTRDEALEPAMLSLPNLKRKGSSNNNFTSHKVLVWAASDHPSEWAPVQTFHLIDYSAKTRERLKQMISSQKSALKVFSVHWGPNYIWTPAKEIRALAHYLIDECGIDIIHGHSSHHVQGVENYNGKLIIYGCGDFVDDYALVPEYRNDLSAVWRVVVREDGDSLRLEKLEVFPTKIKSFQAHLMSKTDADHEFTVDKIRTLSKAFETTAEQELGDQGQLVFNL